MEAPKKYEWLSIWTLRAILTMVENWMRKISSDSGLISLSCAVEKNIHFNLGEVQSKKWRKSECGGEFKENSCYFHRTSTVNEESEWILCVFFAAAQPIFPLSHTPFVFVSLVRSTRYTRRLWWGEVVVVLMCLRRSVFQYIQKQTCGTPERITHKKTVCESTVLLFFTISSSVAAHTSYVGPHTFQSSPTWFQVFDVFYSFCLSFWYESINDFYKEKFRCSHITFERALLSEQIWWLHGTTATAANFNFLLVYFA